MSTTIYLIRHGEVEHHRSDVGLTARGRQQAHDKGRSLAEDIAGGSRVFMRCSPVSRVRQTATLIHAALSTALAESNRDGRLALEPPASDPALCNTRFILDGRDPPLEPSYLYRETTDPAFLARLPARQAEFYRGFWASSDPMGYWLAQDSGGAAETAETVLERLFLRLRSVLDDDRERTADHCWLLITHSGTMRALLRKAIGVDPGEPDFCEHILARPTGDPKRVRLEFRGETVALRL